MFEKYRLRVEKLDKDRSGRRPDYLIINSSNQKAIVECKYIASSGLMADRKTHISTLDPDLPDSGVYQPDNAQKYWSVISEARLQFIQLVNDFPDMDNLPFIVVIGCDFLVWDFDLFVPKNIYDFVEISAIMSIEKDIELKKAFEKYSLEDIKRMLDGELEVYKPSPTIRFKVLLNGLPRIKFKPETFLKNPILV